MPITTQCRWVAVNRSYATPPYFRAFRFATSLIMGSLLGLTASAQTDQIHPRADFQTWYDASLKLNLKKGWEITTQYRVRFYNNAHDYRGSYFFLTGEKKINKYINILANYRLSLLEHQAFHRFALGFHAKYKLGRWTPFLRPMVQNQNQYFQGDDENGGNGKTYLRMRAGTKYRISKLFDAYVYAEPFYDLGQSGLPVAFWQNSAGLSADLTKHMSLTAYYIWQPELQIKNAQTKDIVGVSLSFELKPGKGSKKEKKQDTVPQF